MISAAELQLGDHVCLPFDTDEAAQAYTVEFTAAGLAGGQRVMLFTQTVSVATMVDLLRQHGRTFAAALGTGQLQVRSPDDLHLAGGHFDSRRTIAAYAEATDRAEADGYQGLRIRVDMVWALLGAAGVEDLLDFEAAANRLCTEGRLATVCAYDRRRFDPAAIRRACAAHLITPGVSMLRIAHLPTPGLALRGEVDLANRQALIGVLASLPDTDITLDLTGLTFIDAGGMGLIARTAAARAHRTTVRCTPAIARLLRLVNLDAVATIVETGGRRRHGLE